MKKLLLIVIVATSLMACEKQGQCYNCQVVNDYVEYCGDINEFRPKDSQGNDLNIYCTPK
jgi:hypothetical protein